MTSENLTKFGAKIVTGIDDVDRLDGTCSGKRWGDLFFFGVLNIIIVLFSPGGNKCEEVNRAMHFAQFGCFCEEWQVSCKMVCAGGEDTHGLQK